MASTKSRKKSSRSELDAETEAEIEDLKEDSASEALSENEVIASADPELMLPIDSDGENDSVFPANHDSTEDFVLTGVGQAGDADTRRPSRIPPQNIARQRKSTLLSFQRLSLSTDAQSSDESQAEEFKDRPASPDLPAEYWQVQRLIKYIKAGNSTATILALSSLRDYNLQDRFVQMAIKDSGGLEVLLNILETDESRCKTASLLVIRDITSSSDISRSVFNMRGLETLVQCLSDPSNDLKPLTAETIANVCKIKKARRAMRKSEGISRLVDMMDIEELNSDQNDEKHMEIARCGALALWSLAKSTKNKEAIRKAGGIPLLAKLMKTNDVDVIIPVVGILQECASETTFRIAIRTEGLLDEFVSGLLSSNQELAQFCAKAIYVCAEDEESRETVYRLGAVDPLIAIIEDRDLKQNKPLLAAATGAIWKCASAICNTNRYLEKGLVDLLGSLLEDEPEEVLINVAGAIHEIAMANPSNASLIREARATPKLTSHLTSNNTRLLVNTTRAVGELAKDHDTRREMEKLDVFRLVWSLLKHCSPLVQSAAAWAICPYVENSKDSGDMVRTYVGGLEALVHLLGSDNVDVQAAVSHAIAAIAVNNENLAIMSDHGVVQFLSRLASTPRGDNDLLRRCLANAIAECCKWGENSGEFGRRKAVSPICSYLTSSDPVVHRAAAKALCALSSDPRNCITIHQCGVVPYLINMSGSLDEELRNASAGVMANIRQLALSVENVRLK